LRLTLTGEFADVAAITEELVTRAFVGPDDLMLIGARCRDLLHHAHGHAGPLRRTDDVDVGLAVASDSEFRRVTELLEALGDTGARFKVGAFVVDILPFGGIEEPAGTVTVSARYGALSVAGFGAVWHDAARVECGASNYIRVPRTSGYAILKAHAFAERAQRFEYKDSDDIAVVLDWYATSDAVADSLYDTELGASILARFDFEPDAASAFMLGQHMLASLPPADQEQLRLAWKGAPDSILLEACAKRSPAGRAGSVVRAFRESIESEAPASTSKRVWPL